MPYSAIIRRIPATLNRQLVAAGREGLPPDLAKWRHEDLLDAAGVALGLPHCEISEDNADFPAFLANSDLYVKLRCVPLFRMGILVVVATAEPWSESCIREIRKKLQSEVHLMGATESDIDSALAHLQDRARLARDEEKAARPPPDFSPPVKHWAVKESATQEAIRVMVREAYRLGASDIILDPMENRLRVRFRIHGVAEEMPPIPRQIGQGVVSAFKAYSNLNTDELPVPQSGGCRITFDDGRLVDLRVECQPTAWGSALVIRLLDPESISRHMGTLPFVGRDHDIVRSVMDQTQGIIVVTGPTGSGKTTTLYRMLSSIDLSENNVRTIEDPVEYKIDGIAQVLAPRDRDQRPQFAEALRSHLRADPDVIMVGEVRDPDTASTAIQAALTGHMIYTTLHTTSAAGTIRRLIELGVSAFLLRETLSLVIAQRLVAKLCPRCKIAVPPTPDVCDHLRFHGLEVPGEVYIKGGCPACNGTGIVGRLPVFELMHFSGGLASHIREDMEDDKFVETWIKGGGEPLAKRALMLMAKGETYHKEVRGLDSRFIPEGGWLEE